MLPTLGFCHLVRGWASGPLATNWKALPTLYLPGHWQGHGYHDAVGTPNQEHIKTTI